MGQGVEVCGAVAVTNPETFLSGGFEAGIVAFALSTQGIDTLEVETFPVNRKSVIRWNRHVFCTVDNSIRC